MYTQIIITTRQQQVRTNVTNRNSPQVPNLRQIACTHKLICPSTSYSNVTYKDSMWRGVGRGRGCLSFPHLVSFTSDSRHFLSGCRFVISGIPLLAFAFPASYTVSQPACIQAPRSVKGDGKRLRSKGKLETLLQSQAKRQARLTHVPVRCVESEDKKISLPWQVASQVPRKPANKYTLLIKYGVEELSHYSGLVGGVLVSRSSGRGGSRVVQVICRNHSNVSKYLRFLFLRFVM